MNRKGFRMTRAQVVIGKEAPANVNSPIPPDSEIRGILRDRIDKYKQSVGIVVGTIGPSLTGVNVQWGSGRAAAISWARVSWLLKPARNRACQWAPPFQSRRPAPAALYVGTHPFDFLRCRINTHGGLTCLASGAAFWEPARSTWRMASFSLATQMQNGSDCSKPFNLVSSRRV
jgi:hypothetical protein